jgi:hypothetical protein
VAGNAVDVTGFVRPEYNGVHTVTDVIFNSTLNGWIVRTDLPWIFNSPTIGGTIRFANGQKTTRLNLGGGEDYNAFNARWEKGEYKKSYDEYVVDGICESEKKISTIYKSYFPSKQFFWRERKNWAPIQPDAICHLLVHNEIADATEGLWIETFDKGDNQLSLSFMKNNSGNELDYYGPVGLLDIVNSGDLIDNIGSISNVLNDIAYYVVWAGPEPCPEECCIEMELCYEDRGNTTCFVVEFERINDNLFEGTDSEFGILFTIERTAPGSQWNLIQDDGDGTIVIAESFDISDCPSDMNDWSYGGRFEEYWGEGSTLEIRPGDHCESEECCLTYTEKIPFLVDGCTRYTPWTIIFKDRRGSWAQYPFKMISRDFIETERTNFYQQEGTFTDNDFFYDPFNDRGEKSFVTRSREKIRLSSDWVRDQQNYIIEDMFKSVELYIQNPETGEVKGIMINNKEYESKKDINDMIHHYEFDINYTTDDWRL